jgi:hypothetical protein
MHRQPTQDNGSAAATIAPPLPGSTSAAQPDEPAGYELLVCLICGRQRTPRPSERHHTVPCRVCGANDYRRLAIVALAPDDLELLIELVEDSFAPDRGRVLDKLYAERRYAAIDAFATCG